MTKEELLAEINIIYDMLQKENPDTYHYVEQLLIAIGNE